VPVVHAGEALRLSLTSRDQDTQGLVWVGLKCMHKGLPMSGASLHAASDADYQEYVGGRKTFDGSRDVIGFVSNGMVTLLIMMIMK
jgi:hypothetical protein